MAGPGEIPFDLLNEHSRQLEALEGSVAQLSRQLDEWRPFFEEGLQSTERGATATPAWATRLEGRLMALEEMQQVVNDLQAKLTHLSSELSEERNVRTVAVEEWRANCGITEKLTAELRSIGEKLNRFVTETRGAAGTSASQQAAQTTPVPASDVPTAAKQLPDTSAAPGSSILRWSRRLAKIEYREVKNFVKQFTDFVNVTKICDSVAKLLLLQHLDGPALAFAESTPDKAWQDILKEMAARVRPSRHVVLNELVSCKQNRHEKIRDFALRFYSILDEHPELSTASDEIRAILIDLLTPYWQATARSIVFQNPEINIESLFKGMTDIEGPNTSTTNVNEIQPSHSVQNVDDSRSAPTMGSVVSREGRINWQEIRAPRKLLIAWRQLVRTNPSLREECIEWLQRGPRRNFQFDRRTSSRSRGKFQYNRNDFQSRQNGTMNQGGRIFNLQENPMNPHDDTMFDDNDTPPDDVDIAMIDWTDSVGTGGEITQTQNSEYRDFPLMYVRCKLNETSCQCLVDTGAGASIIPYSKVQKIGAGIDKSKCRILSSFNGARTRTKGVSTIEGKVPKSYSATSCSKNIILRLILQLMRSSWLIGWRSRAMPLTPTTKPIDLLL